MKATNFKQGTRFNVGGKTFISAGTMRYPAASNLRIVLVADPVTQAESGYYFLDELRNGLKTGFVTIIG